MNDVANLGVDSVEEVNSASSEARAMFVCIWASCDARDASVNVRDGGLISEDVEVIPSTTEVLLFRVLLILSS